MNTFEKQLYRDSILYSDFYKYYTQFRNELFDYDLQGTYSKNPELYSEFDGTIYRYFSEIYPNEWNECRLIYQSLIMRLRRLKLRIGFMINLEDCVFATLTFNDHVLDNTNELSRRRYVQRFLKQFNTFYIANVDYGDLFEREHYHVLINVRELDTHLWQYGIINVKHVRRDVKDINCLSEYVLKLSKHAVKNIEFNSHILYSSYFNPTLDKQYSHERKQRLSKLKYYEDNYVNLFGDLIPFDTLEYVSDLGMLSLSDYYLLSDSEQMEMPLD